MKDALGFEIIEEAPAADAAPGPKRDAMGFEILPDTDAMGFEIIAEAPKAGLWDRAKAAIEVKVGQLKSALAPGLQAMGEALAQDPAANDAAGDAIRAAGSEVLSATQAGLDRIADAQDMLPGAIPGAGGPNVARALAHPLQPIVPLPRAANDPDRSTAGQVLAGTANVGAGIIEGLTSPLGVATLGTGALPVAVQRLVAGAFAADMLSKLPDAAAEAGTASVDGNLQQKVEAFGNLAATAGMAGLAGRHSVTPRSVSAPRALAREIERAPIDAAALERPVEPVIEKLDRPFPPPPEPTAAPAKPTPRPTEATPSATAGQPGPAAGVISEPVAGSDTLQVGPSDSRVIGSPLEPAGLPSGTTPTTGVRMPVAVNRVVPGSQDIPGIFRQLERVMDVAGSPTPIRAGRMGQYKRWASGFFRPREEVIRLNSAFNIPTATHEVAHSLAASFFSRPAGKSNASGILTRTVPKPVLAELRKLGQNLYGSRKPAAGYVEEGWAEYVRHYLTTDEALKVAPATDAWFRKTILPGKPEVAKELGKARDLIDVWRGQGDSGRARAMQKPYAGKLEQWRQQFRKAVSVQAQVEQLTPLEQASKFWQRRTGKPLPPGQDPFMIASRLRGIAPGVMDRFVHRAPVDIDGNPTGTKPLADVLAPLLADFPRWERATHAVAPALAKRVQERIEDFGIYLWARRTLERAAKKQETGLSVDDAQTLLARLDSPKFRLAADGYRDWWDSVLDYYAQAGPANAELVQAIRAGSKDYVPLPRAIDPAEARSGAAAGQGGGLYRMRGSGRPIYDVMESTLRVAETMIEKAHRDLVANSVIDLSRKPGMGWLVEEVPLDRVRQAVSVERIREQLEAMGVDTSMVAPDAMLEWYTEARDPKGVDPVYARRDAGGKVRWFALKPDVYEVLAGVDNPKVAANLLAQFTAATTRVFKLGTTGLRPAFNLITNPLRDAQNFWLQVQGTANPARALGALMASTGDMMAASLGFGRVKPSAWWEALHDLGVPMANSLAHDIAQTRSSLRGAWHGRVLRDVTRPLNVFRELIGGFEAVPREAQLRILAAEMGWKPGMPLTRDQAVALTVAAKRVTTDFTAGGTVGREMNMYVPFYNASIQGARATARTVRSAVDRQYADRIGASQRQALGRVALGGAFLMTLGLGNWLRNRDKEWYRAMPWRERFLFTNIELDDGTVARVPRPIDWGNLFMVLPEALADSWYREDPETAVKAIEHIVANSNPIGLPVPLNAALEQAANRDFFWDRPIVPRGEQDLLPGEQRSEYSSWLATALGDAFPTWISPRRVDALVRQFGGGAASDLVQALGLQDQLELREREAADMPVVGVLFRRGGTYSAVNRHTAEFYDLYSYFAARSKSQERPLDMREAAFWDRLRREKENMDFVRGVAIATKELRSRQILWQRMGERARGVVEDAKKLKLHP